MAHAGNYIQAHRSLSQHSTRTASTLGGGAAGALAVMRYEALGPLEVGLLGAEAAERAADQVADVAEQPVAADDLVGTGRGVSVVGCYGGCWPGRHHSIPTFPDVDGIIDRGSQAGKQASCVAPRTPTGR